ncbi:unnamed protein product, partial [Leptidea sinapis]
FIMAWGLPKLPGLTFPDPTKTQHHMRSSLRYYQGHSFDPSLTYGRVKQAAPPAVIPHWVHYDKRCLNFTAFFKQPVYENPDEHYRIRVVNIEWLESQGVELSKEEDLPEDPYTKKERWKSVQPPQKKKLHTTRLLLRNSMMIEAAKILTFPSIALEVTDDEVTQYYSPIDLIVGETIFVLGRRFLIFDCDKFTRHYYKSMLNIEQPQRIQVFHETKKEFPKIIGCDLFVYRYMSANPEKFPQEVIDNVRNYHMREGNLKDELEAAVAEPNAMERCLTALNVVEGSATPPRPSTPPMTTDHISYDDTLRYALHSKPTCDNVVPLKGILKSGASKDDEQKVVCFTGPAADGHRETPRVKPVYPPGQQPHYDDDEDFCEHLKPEVPEHMRLAPDAYDNVKNMRRDVPEISPAAARIADHPKMLRPDAPVSTCLVSESTGGPCAPRKPEDVAFACEHVEPVLPCCEPDKRQ